MPRWNLTHGVVDVVVNETTNDQSAQAAFKKAYDAFERWVTFGYCEQVALYYGISGTGTDFYDGVNPFTDNAWFVYRFPPTRNRKYSFYAHMQYSESGNFGGGGGSPALITGGTGDATANSGQLGIQIAVGITSAFADGNPWNGTSNFDGADTKGASVWAAPGGGTVHVWPRSNNTGGTHVTNKENFFEIVDQGGATVIYRYDFVSDGDNLHIMLDFGDASALEYFYFGPYRLRQDLGGPTQVPYIGIHTNDAVGESTGTTVPVYGDLTGAAFDEGGVLWDPSVGVKQVSLLSFGEGSSVTNDLGTSYDSSVGASQGIPVYPIVISSEETGSIGIVGQSYTERFGITDQATLAANDVHPSVSPYTLRQYEKGAGAYPWECVVLWAGDQAPRSTSTRAGRNV